MADIRFGTDGWRAVIAEDFTFANVRLVAQAIADYLLDPEREKLEIYHMKTKGSYSCRFMPASAGISLGYDTRFLSGEFAFEAAKVLSANGIPVFLSDKPSSTPAVSFSVKSGKRAGAVVITASHNPPKYNGMKFKPEYASSGLPEVMSFIEKKVQDLLAGAPDIKSEPSAPIVKFSPRVEYLSQLEKLVDLKLIASKNFCLMADTMHGTTIGYLKSLIEGAGGNLTEIRNQINPSFGGVNPEPIDKNLSLLIEAVKEKKCDAGFAFDGDGDRIGAVDSKGRFLNSHYIFSLMLRHLVENKKWSGGVVKTFSTTQMVNILCDKYGLKLYETPIGFKYICRLMLEEDILIGGEESGGIGIKNHIPERDGILCALILLEAMAYSEKSIGELLDELMIMTGTFYYDRTDLHIESNEKKESFMEKLSLNPPENFDEMTLKEVQLTDGVKLLFKDKSWILFRPSGTEPVLRVYVESTSREKVGKLLKAGEKLASGGK